MNRKERVQKGSDMKNVSLARDVGREEAGIHLKKTEKMKSGGGCGGTKVKENAAISGKTGKLFAGKGGVGRYSSV